MTDNIILKKMSASPWVYDSTAKTYTLTIDGTKVAMIDSSGNLRVKGRVLKL